MPSNKDLIAAIKAADAEAVTDGLNNAELADLLKGLKTEAEAEAEVPTHSVATGVALVTRKGILGEHAEVRAEWLNGGVETLNALIKRDKVVKN